MRIQENAKLHFNVEDQGMDVSLPGGLKQVNPQSHQGQGGGHCWRAFQRHSTGVSINGGTQNGWFIMKKIIKII